MKAFFFYVVKDGVKRRILTTGDSSMYASLYESESRFVDRFRKRYGPIESVTKYFRPMTWGDAADILAEAHFERDVPYFDGKSDAAGELDDGRADA